MRFWLQPGLVLSHLLELAWLPFVFVIVFVQWLFCVLCCGFGPEELKSGIHVVSTVAFGRVDSGTSQEGPAAEHESLPCWLRGQGGGVVVHDSTEFACCACSANLNRGGS